MSPDVAVPAPGAPRNEGVHPAHAWERPGRQLIVRSLLRGRSRLALLAAWSTAEAAPALVSGLCVAKAVDEGFLRGDFRTGLLWLGALLAAHAVGAIATRFTFPVVGSLVEPLRDDLLRSVVRGIVHNGSTGSGAPDSAAVSRVTQQVETVRRSTATLLNGLRRFVFTLGATALGLAALAAEVLWVALPPVLASTLLFVLLLKTLIRRQHAAILANERVAGDAGDALSGSRDIAAFREQDRVVEQVGDVLVAERAAQQRLARATATRSVVTAVGAHLPLLSVLVAVPWLLDRGVSVGVLVGAATYLSTNIEPAMRMLTEVIGGAGLQLAVTVRRLAEADPGGPPGTTPCGPPPVDGGVRVEGLGFAYGPHSEPVIEDLDLTVRDGGHLAIIGPSGIGKSTLAALIAGLIEPDHGRVLVGGSRPGTLSPELRRRQIALIPQESYVFTGTVGENLRYLRPEADTTEMAAAVHAVGADPLVLRLGGWEGRVVPEQLSQGEKQILGLVRAYLCDAPITILDEASCYLDPGAEAGAEKAFRRRPGTLIVIAHRADSALRADRVLLLDGARARFGEHARLLETSPLYAELMGHHAR